MCRCVLIGVVAGALMSLAVQVLAFEPILERAKDQRAAEMQILIGGIGVAIIPLAIAQHHTKSNPFGFSESLPGGTPGRRRPPDHERRRSSRRPRAGPRAGIAPLAARLPARAGAAAIGVDAEIACADGHRQTAAGAASRWRSPARWPAWPACCSPTTSAPSPRRAATRCCSRRSPCIILGGVGSMLRRRLRLLSSSPSPRRSCSPRPPARGSTPCRFGLIFLVLLVRPAGVFGRKEVRRT